MEIHRSWEFELKHPHHWHCLADIQSKQKKCGLNIAVAMFKQLKETRESPFCDIIFNSREATMIPVCMTESYCDLSVCTLLFVLSPSYQVQCASFRGQLPHMGSAAHWVSLLPRLGHHFPVTALWPYCVKFCCPWVWARILLVKSIFEGMQSVGSRG